MKGLQKSLVIIFLTIFGVLFSISNSWGLKDIGMKIQCNNVSITDLVILNADE